MTAWLGPAAMVLAAVGALGCVLKGRPRHPGAVIAAAVMVLAMADMALGHLLLTPMVWAGVLVGAGVFVVALPRAGDDHLLWQHGLALVAAAAIMIVSPHALPTASAVSGHAGHAAPPGWTSGWVVGLTVALAYAGVALLPLRRPRSPAASTPATVGLAPWLEVVTTTGCLVLMAVVPILPSA